MDTKLFVRQQAGGMFAVLDREIFPGSIYWLGSGTGTDGAGYGRNPDAPFATLGYAAAAAADAAVDTIMALPGHAETKSVTGNLANLSLSGLRVWGNGEGALRPTFTLGHAGATLTVSGANVDLRGFKVISDIADVAVGITVAATADGFRAEDLLLTDGGLTKELVIGIQIAAACDGCLIRGNRFYTTISDETGGCASAIKLVGESIRTRIIGNISHGHYTAANIDGVTAAATQLYIARNESVNIDTGAGLCISLHASTTGIGRRNESSGAKATVHPHVGAAFHWFSSFGNDAAGSNSLLSPAVGSFAA